MNSYVAAMGRAGTVNNAMFTGKKGTGFIETRHQDCSFSDTDKIAGHSARDQTGVLQRTGVALG
jgi:hypothetical protein